jgi:hypothetical protein
MVRENNSFKKALSYKKINRLNSSPRAAADFWEKKDWWLPTWNYKKNDDSHMQVDYVRVWAL